MDNGIRAICAVGIASGLGLVIAGLWIAPLPAAGEWGDPPASAPAAEPDPSREDPRTPGTRAMAQQLKDFADRARITRNPYLNDRRVERLRELEPPPQRANL